MSSENLPAVVDAESRALPFLDPTNQTGTVWTSISTKDEVGKLLRLRVMQSADFHADDCEGKKFQVEHVLCHRVQITDRETGEIRDGVRTVVVSPSRETLDTTSPYFWAGIRDLCAVMGAPPFKPAVEIVVKKQKGTGKRQFLTFDTLGRAK